MTIGLDGVQTRLHIRSLQKRYRKAEVLKQLTYTFDQGKIYGIIGRNGAGKTTLFNCISDNLPFEGGEILLEIGGKLRTMAFEDVGIVSDTAILPDFLTGYEFIDLFMKFHPNKGKMTLDQYFNLINIGPQDQHKLIRAYSLGMKNKIQLLACLIKNPRVILLDEPLSSFDVIVSHDIKKLLVEMRSNHIILMSTHILQLATDISDKILFLKQGQLMDSAHKTQDAEAFETYIIEELSKEGA